MSRLDKGNTLVMIFPEIESFDEDGNPFRKASDEGYERWVLIQPLPQSGTSARRAEQDNEGFETEQIYRMRFRRRDDFSELGPRSYIIWNDEMWQVFGHPTLYNSSPRTRHFDYTLKRT